MSVTITFAARPEKSMAGQGIISWYTDYGFLGDFLEAYAEHGKMSYNKETRLYEITFTPNKNWPKTLEEQADEADIYLGNPDNNGNYPIDGYVVEGKILSINGQHIEPR